MTIGKPRYHVEFRLRGWNWEIASVHRSLHKARQACTRKREECRNQPALRYRIVMEQEVR